MEKKKRSQSLLCKEKKEVMKSLVVIKWHPSTATWQHI